MKAILNSLTAIQIFIMLMGLFLIREADKAMDKSGIGDVDLWREYNSEAGVVIFCSAILWILTVLLIIACKQTKEKNALLAIGIPPVVFFVGWVALIWFL